MTCANVPEQCIALSQTAKDFKESVIKSRYGLVDECRLDDATSSFAGSCNSSVGLLKCMLAQHEQLHSKLQDTSSDHFHILEISSRRQDAVHNFMCSLDSAIEQLESSLDGVSDQLKQPIQYAPSAEEVIKYAHRIRMTTFARAGAVSLPPTPQPWQMALSNLSRHAREQANRERLQQNPFQNQIMSQNPIGQGETVQAPLSGPSYPEGLVLADGQALTTGQMQAKVEQAHPEPNPPSDDQLPAAPAQPPVLPSAFDFILNPHLEVVDDYSSSEGDSEDEESDE